MCWPSPASPARSARPQSAALVTGEVVEQGRGAKILVFHYKRKKQYKKLRGHRQGYTAVRITEIAFDGQKFTAPELPKKEAKPKKVKPVEAEDAPKVEAKAGRAGKESSSQKGSAKESQRRKRKSNGAGVRDFETRNRNETRNWKLKINGT